MKRILILTASFGDGPDAAARNLSDALESLSSEAKVEVLDVFQSSYGTFNTMARKAYSRLVRFAPAVWGRLYSLLDRPASPDKRYFKRGRLQRDLGDMLLETQPDVVVSTYPVYSTMLRDLYRDHIERPFRLVSVITDSVSIDSAWLQAPSDLYCVATEATAVFLQARAIPTERIKTLGFPVSPSFSQQGETALAAPEAQGPCRILYLVNTGKTKLGKTVKQLLEGGQNQLTIALGGNASLRPGVIRKLKRHGERVQVVQATDQMPSLLRTHHLLIGPAGGALFQEAIAACCPIIANQVLTEEQEGNAQLLIDHDLGVVACKPREIAHWVKRAFKHNGKQWRRWRRNLAMISKPDASLRIARLLLEGCESVGQSAGASVGFPLESASALSPSEAAASGLRSHPLLCDFHIHTNYSDGKLSVADVVDFYGRRHFDCICITDHLADPRRLIGKLGKLSRLTLHPSQFEEYFEVIERERQRAWRRYGMLVMAGLEFNKDGLTKKSSAHLLGIDLHAPIMDCLDLPETIAQIHAQGGLAVASHPHIMKSEWGKDTLYLWENQERFAPLLDAWEVANRNNMFNPVSTKRLPYLGNSDFHKPKHIYSWKTLVTCEKNAEAIKECIRKNEKIAITLYREECSAVEAPAIAASTTDRMPISLEIRPKSEFLPAA